MHILLELVLDIAILVSCLSLDKKIQELIKQNEL